jgi:hypothetical protein
MKILDGHVDIFNPPLKQPDTKKNQTPGRDRDEQYTQQLRRVDDYRAAALTNPSPFEAVISAANSDLLELLARLAEAIRKASGDSALTLEALPAYEPTLDTYLRVAKQIAQFSHLQELLSRTEKSARQNRRRQS